MKCPKCQSENREEARFCLDCGRKLERNCPQCGKPFPLSAKFCDECGQRLEEIPKAERIAVEAGGERKYVTVLFSDLSGYTAMAEKLDPEEVKEITTRIFTRVSQVIAKYDGFVEKFIGDAVVALFGVPKLHEDDPVRAIRAAREIHEIADTISPEVEKRIGRFVAMHSGINTGLVVTGEVDMERGTHGVAGDTLNVAARLQGLAKRGEILIGQETYHRAEGYFEFEKLMPTVIKGKDEAVQVYRVLSAKEKPEKTHRISGFRADLIGRKAEMTELLDAVERLQDGKGSIISISGAAGTGKSRLVEEFKANLKAREIQWFEGHAYAYAQNIPYFVVVDLLNRVFQIKEGDPPSGIKKKIETKVESLTGKKDEIVPFVGSLYSLAYVEADKVSPEALKSRLHDSLKTLISTMAQKISTVFFLEDLHWADSSSIEFLRNSLLAIRTQAIVLCAYRPPFALFTTHQLTSIGKRYQEILLQDLSLSDAQNMLESLLRTNAIPHDLKTFVQEKSEGNPFYLEELVNSLIDSNSLIQDKDTWRLTKSFSELGISSTINGVISSRIDRLEREKKRILQEASVIGRAFLYQILTRITDLKQGIDRSIRGLEQLDLIRAKAFEPDLEYIFKHALTQEVVYNGLLKKERQIIHEKIGLVMEELFRDRLPDFYETLAFHFKQSRSIHKAVDYLSKSGEKSFRKSALAESYQYFSDAYDILSNAGVKTRDEERLLIDLIIKWSLPLRWCANFQQIVDLFSAHTNIVESLEDKDRLGMFYACLGYALGQVGELEKSFEMLKKAQSLCKETENSLFEAYSSAWLAVTCAEFGLLDEAVEHGKRSSEISRQLEWDPILLSETLPYSATAHEFRGETKEGEKIATALLDAAKTYSDDRVMTSGLYHLGLSRFYAGDFLAAIEILRRGIMTTKDPIFVYGFKLFLGWAYLSNDQTQEAEGTLVELTNLAGNVGDWTIKTAGEGFLGLIMISRGDLAEGVRIVNDLQRFHLEKGYRYRYAAGEYMLGRIYSRMVQGAGPKSLSFIVRNIGFLAKNVPIAAKKAEGHFNKAIEVAKEIGAKGTLAQAYLYLGLLHKAKGKTCLARECISEAVKLFETCHADVYLKKAREALVST